MENGMYEFLFYKKENENILHWDESRGLVELYIRKIIS